MHVYLAFLLELTTALVLDLPSPRLQAIRTHKLLLLLVLYPSLTLYVVFDPFYKYPFSLRRPL